MERGLPIRFAPLPQKTCRGRERWNMRKISKAARLALAVCLLGLSVRGAEVSVKVIRSESDLPEKFCDLWRSGDLLISDGLSLVLIGGTPRPLKTQNGYQAPDALGSILAFVPSGRSLRSTMNIGAPQVRIKDKTEYLTYRSVIPGAKNPADGSLSVVCAGAVEKKGWGRLEIKTSYRFFPGEGKILLDSTVKNVGSDVCRDLSYSLYSNANHSYSFSPYDAASFPRLNFRVYPRAGHYLAWLNPNPIERRGQRNPGTLAPGETYKVQYALYAALQPGGLLETLYRARDLKGSNLSLNFKDVDGKSIEVVVREIVTSSVFFRTFLEAPFALDIPLPEGRYSVRANFFPAVAEEIVAVKPGAKNVCVIKNPGSGVVKIQIKNGRSEYVPGKVSVIGLSPTRTPYFRPENPRETGRSYETFKDSVCPAEGGTEIRLPVGAYLLTASRGPEYTREQRTVEVLKGEDQNVVFAIDKVLETRGLISLDPHLHTQNSDGRTLIPARLKSIVAEGVDVAVATDHNYVTDYAPALKELGLDKYLAVIPGSEVTKPSVIHYNTFPMKIVPEEGARGAIDIVPDSPGALFASSRSKNPGAVIQVNHPRSGDLGYFNNFDLDKEKAAAALPGFDPSFELMEVMNGPSFDRGNREAVEDWLHILNRGYYFPAVGSSDSHGIDESEPGFSRTYVYYSGGKGQQLDTEALIGAFRKGHSFVSNGPLVDFKVNGRSGPGDTLTSRGGKIDVSLKVSSAPWVSVDEIRLIVNGERTIVLPVKADEKSTEKLRKSISLKLERDAALVVEVTGRRTLYPVVQSQTSEGQPSSAVLPYAITNPVFVDVDGNGKFDPIWPEKIKIKAGASDR